MWKVDARTKNGGSRRFFRTKAQAETFALQCRVQKENEGTGSFGNAELARYGKKPHDAIVFYLEHLRQQSRSIPLADAVAELIDSKLSAQRSNDYCYHLRLRLGRFSQEFPDRTVASFTAKELDGWLAGLAAAPGTRNTFRRDLRTLFAFCERRGYCESNEAAKTDRASDIDAPPGILTPSQCLALLGACDDIILPYVAIGLFAGLRTAELKKLDWSEIDLDGGHIEVTASKSKTKRRRLVPIAENLGAWLLPLARPVGSIAPIGLRKRFKTLKSSAGLIQWPHNALRHSFGSYRIAQCHDAARVSLEMGNSPDMVFAHYRELVKPKDAEMFWRLSPSKAVVRKVVAIG